MKTLWNCRTNWVALFAVLLLVTFTQSALAQGGSPPPPCDDARPDSNDIANFCKVGVTQASCTPSTVNQCTPNTSQNCGSWTAPIDICNPPSQGQFCTAVHAALLNT